MAKGLTSKQEAFCEAYVAQDGPKSQSDAYRAAFNCERMKPATIWNKASDLMKVSEVRVRIKELTDEAAQKAVVKLKDHIDELKKLRDQAAAAGQYGAAIKAEMARGKASGLYVERQESSVDAKVSYSWEDEK